jgi:Recombination endonuclease VII
MDQKACTRCKIYKLKNLEFFPPHNKTKDGLDSWCRKCRASYRSEINRGKFRGQLTDEEVKLLKKQKTCDICGEEDIGGSRNHKHIGKTNLLVMDHNHSSGKFRGMLCNHCNRGLGHFKDDISRLEMAINYLKKNC